MAFFSALLRKRAPTTPDGRIALTLSDWEDCQKRLQDEARKERQRLLTTEPGFGQDRESLLKLLWLSDQIHESWSRSYPDQHDP